MDVAKCADVVLCVLGPYASLEATPRPLSGALPKLACSCEESRFHAWTARSPPSTHWGTSYSQSFSQLLHRTTSVSLAELESAFVQLPACKMRL